VRFIVVNDGRRLKVDLLMGVLSICLFLYMVKGNIYERLIKSVRYVTFCYFFLVVLRGGLRPIWGSDATEYLSNALKFIETMSFTGINNFNGVNDGSLLAIIHHPGWILYLAFGLLHTSGDIGFPNDYVVRFAIQFCLICLFIAGIGLVSLLGKRGNSLWLGILMPISYEMISHVFKQHTRDAYRIIPLLIFIGILIFWGQAKMNKRKIESGAYIISFVTCMFIMIGHPINALQAIIIVVAFFIWLFMNRCIDNDIIFLGISSLIGGLVGMYQIIWAYVMTGKMTGVKIDIDKLLINSDYYRNYMDYSERRLRGANSYFERLKLILLQDKGVLLVPAICIAIIIIFICMKKKDYKNILIPFSVLVILQSLLFTDIVSWSGGTLSEWSVKNWRYTLQIYVIYGIFVGSVLGKIFDSQNKHGLLRIGILFYSCLPLFMLLAYWEKSERNQIVYNRISEYREINEHISQANCKILLDNYYCNYYLYNKGLSIFTDNAESIRMALTLDELDIELRKVGCDSILIMDSLRDVYWNGSILEKYTESEYIKERIDTSFCKVYLIK